MIGVKYVTAPLLTRMSTPPRAASASPTSLSRSSRLARSAAMARARPPATVIRLTVSLMVPSRGVVDGSTVRAVTATVAPSAAKRSAIKAPIPRLAPVTMALRPASTPSLMICSPRPLGDQGLLRGLGPIRSNTPISSMELRIVEPPMSTAAAMIGTPPAQRQPAVWPLRWSSWTRDDAHDRATSEGVPGGPVERGPGAPAEGGWGPPAEGGPGAPAEGGPGAPAEGGPGTPAQRGPGGPTAVGRQGVTGAGRADRLGLGRQSGCGRNRLTRGPLQPGTVRVSGCRRPLAECWRPPGRSAPCSPGCVSDGPVPG